MARQDYEMSQADLDGMLASISAARKTSGMFLSGGMPMSDVQATANAEWAKLGARMGFDPMSVRPTGRGDRFFSAVPTSEG